MRFMLAVMDTFPFGDLPFRNKYGPQGGKRLADMKIGHEAQKYMGGSQGYFAGRSRLYFQLVASTKLKHDLVCQWFVVCTVASRGSGF